MKTPLALALLATLLGIVLFPVLSQGRRGPTRISLARMRRDRAERARVEGALAAFRRGDPSRETEARAAMRALPASDVRRLSFANALLGRGESATAYEVVRPRVRFAAAFGAPNGSEMEFYARIAERAGHPEEAAHARAPENGRFRIWVRGQWRAFTPRHVPYERHSGDYRHAVESNMNVGRKLFPGHGAEVEALRRELLAAP